METGYPELFEWERTGELHHESIEVVRLTNKLGYGDGTISYEDRKSQVDIDIIEAAETAIQSDSILIAVDTDKNDQRLDDDGCGDGRRWKHIFEGEIERFKSLNRSKVFGGGVAMGVASLIGLGRASGQELSTVMHNSISQLNDKMIDFGAHTDDRADGENCGCGAIDKAPFVIQHAVTYESQIRNTILGLGVGTEELDEVYPNYKAYATAIKGQPYSGRQVVDEIVHNGKVVKELTDEHREMFIILNAIPGYTVNQELVREATRDVIQVFGVDVWRMQELAQKLYDNPRDQHKAFLSELIYTLAVAATLTKGDLPVYSISSARAEVAA